MNWIYLNKRFVNLDNVTHISFIEKEGIKTKAYLTFARKEDYFVVEDQKEVKELAQIMTTLCIVSQNERIRNAKTQ
jgi:hypothetical protein